MKAELVKIALGVVVSAALVGCGKEVKEKPMSPLSAEQIDQLESLTRSMDQADEAVQRGKAASGANVLNSLPKGNVGSARKMAEKLNKTVCEFQASPETPGNGAIKQSYLIVKGSSCPITYEARTTTSESKSEFSSAITIDYQVVDNDYRQMNDIDEVKVEGTIGARAVNGGGEFFGTITGSAHSQVIGNIQIELHNGGKVSRSGGSQVVTLTLIYKGTTVVGKVETKYDGNGDKGASSYWINGVPFAEKDFRDIMGSAFFNN